MTATKHVTIWCDAGDCNRFIEVGEYSGFGPARAAARAEGWAVGRPAPRARGGGADFCPIHANQGQRP